MIAAMRAGTDSLVDLGAYQYGGRNLADDSSDPQHVMVGTLTTNILGILGVEPAFGRGFAPEDGLEGAERVVLLDQGLWRNRFGGRTEVLGTRVELDGEAYTVIGVMDANFTFPYGEVKLWVPLELDSPSASWTFENFQPVGRLAEGVDRARALALGQLTAEGESVEAVRLEALCDLHRVGAALDEDERPIIVRQEQQIDQGVVSITDVDEVSLVLDVLVRVAEARPFDGDCVALIARGELLDAAREGR